ncbi:hypothetical protein [Pseudaestuariivita rosea]|uniref:hypothetical protein n=1 Tax=Pseudaestuariivita rosea TaxID=2763263 RepID=UPI001ABBA7FE|nr:hypothetical protein [Pseudaestuariivita rosea]
MLYRIYSLIGAIVLGGSLGYLGFLLFSGTPAQTGNRRAQLFMDAQNWLIEQLGMTNAGLLLMGLGAVIGLYFVWSALFSKHDDEKA